MGAGVFIAGTGTGVGKTLVTSLVLRQLRQRGVDAVPMKPVQTGAIRSGDTWSAPDLEAHLAAAGLSPTPEEYALMAPYCFAHPASPHLSARMEDRSINLGTMVDAYHTLAERHDLVLVEGAGGLLVPLNDTETNLDLLAALDIPLILVSPNILGTINHTLLSLELLKQRGISFLGLVMSQPEAIVDTLTAEENPRAIHSFSHATVLGEIPHLTDFSLLDAIPIDLEPLLALLR